jgi:uncharacterized integral membrane protein
MDPKFKKILIIAGIALILIVIIQNTHAVSLQLLFWQITMPGIIFYPLLFLIGFGVGIFFGLTKRKS